MFWLLRKRPRWKIWLLLGWTGVATGSAFVLFGLGFAAYEAFFLAHSATTSGVVLANVEQIQAADPQTNSPVQTTYCAQFRYQSADGVAHVATESTCSKPPSFRVGDRIAVRYLRQDEGSAQIASWGDQWGFATVFGFAGALTSPVGVAILRRLRRQGHPLDLIAFWEQG